MRRGVLANARRFAVVFSLLVKYLRRSLVAYGVLRSRTVRWSLGALAMLWMAFSCVVVVVFFRPLGGDGASWAVLLDLSWISAVPWVIGAFLMVKLLFANADGVLRVVSLLPVTTVIRGLAVKACETCVVLVAVLVSVLSMVVSSLASTGFATFAMVCMHLVLPAMLLYAVLNLAWDLVMRIMHAIGVPQFASVVGICGLSVALVHYATLILPLVMRIQRRWRQTDDSILWITAVGDLAGKFGMLPVCLVSLLSFLLLVLVDMAIMPPQYCGQADYLPVRCPMAAVSDVGLFSTYVLRSRSTFLEMILAVALSYMLSLRGGSVFAMVPACLVTFTGLSQFSNGIVAAWGRHRRSSAYTYLCMVCSQVIVYSIFWLMLAAFTLLFGRVNVQGYAYSYLGVIAGTIICTALGILFPMTKRNPFAAIVGLGALALVGILLTFAVGLLDLRGLPLAVVLSLILMAVIFYSIFGIQVHQRSIRHGCC